MTALKVTIAGIIVLFIAVFVTYRGAPNPPDSTLAYADEKRTGGIGTYSWSNQRRFWFDAGAAVDAIGIPVPDAALNVPAGATMRFSYGGEPAPVAWSVRAYPIEGDLPRVAEHRWLEDIPDMPELPVTTHGGAADIVAPLAPGDYVIAVDIKVSVSRSADDVMSVLTNSVTYGFHVTVS